MQKKFINNINYDNASWSFDGKTAKNFDKHINNSIPHYNSMHDIALKFSDFFLSEKTYIYDIGCSTGTFVKRLNERHNIKKHNIIGVDVIKKMCIMAKKNNKNYKNVKIINSKIENLKLKNSLLITSFFTMQFIHPSRRQKIFNKIFNSLHWGGGFMLFEKVRYPDARFQDMVSQVYLDFKLEQGFRSDAIINKSRSLKGVMEPFSSAGNMQLLKRAGFKDIVTIFKFACFEGILAIK